MNAEEFKRKLTDYTGQREQAFYWVEVPKTRIWHDATKNELCSDLGVCIKCDEYDSVWECINDLYDSVVSYYEQKGIHVNESSA